MTLMAQSKCHDQIIMNHNHKKRITDSLTFSCASTDVIDISVNNHCRQDPTSNPEISMTCPLTLSEEYDSRSLRVQVMLVM